MRINYNGDCLEFNLVRSDLRGEVAGFLPGVSKEDVPDSLVKYDPRTNTVTVDESASEEYAELAAIHECICCGPNRGLAPKTLIPRRRCGQIDIMLMKDLPKSDRVVYRTKRIEMFEFLINHGLNKPMEKTFRESLATLKSLEDPFV